jgi:hypothetical protein
MLHYKGIITEQPGIKAEPVGNADKNLAETLLYYDDELCDDKSCPIIQEKLQKHFKSETEDIHIQVYYDKEDNRVTIGMTIFFDANEDKSKLSGYKSSFEEYYKKNFGHITN